MKKLKEFLKFIGVFLLYFIIINFLNILFYNDVTNTNNILRNLATTSISLITITIFFFIYYKTIVKDFYNINKEILKDGLKYWLLGYLIMYISNIVLYIIGGDLPINETQNRALILENLYYSIINMAIMAPIIEELIFRRGLRNAFTNKYLFAFTSGLLFSLIHLISEIFVNPSLLIILYIIPYGALGFTFALAYYKTNNIFSSITFHAIHNTIAILLLVIIG